MCDAVIRVFAWVVTTAVIAIAVVVEGRKYLSVGRSSLGWHRWKTAAIVMDKHIVVRALIMIFIIQQRGRL